MKKSIALLFCLCVSLAVFCPGVVSANPTVDDTGCVACHDCFDGLHTIHTSRVHGMSCIATGRHPGHFFKMYCLSSGRECRRHVHWLINTKLLAHDCLSCHSACQAQATVAIDPATVTLNPGDTQTFTATTTGGDNTPAYTWEVQGGTAGTGNTTTGDSIEYTAGNTPGNYTITVTDTANGNVQATAAVTIEAEVTCTVTVTGRTAC